MTQHSDDQHNGKNQPFERVLPVGVRVVAHLQPLPRGAFSAGGGDFAPVAAGEPAPGLPP